MGSPARFGVQQFRYLQISLKAGRHSRKEFAHFLSNSQGSASELETELIIANRLGYLDEASFRYSSMSSTELVV